MIEDIFLSATNFDNIHLAVSPFIKISKCDSEVPFAVEATDPTQYDGSSADVVDKSPGPVTETFLRHPRCEEFINMKITNLSDSQFREKQALFRAAG